MHLSNALGSLGHVGTVLGPCGVTRWQRCDVMGQEGWGGTLNSRGGSGATVSSRANGREQVVVFCCGCFCSTTSPEQLPFAVLGPLLAQPWQLLRD